MLPLRTTTGSSGAASVNRRSPSKRDASGSVRSSRTTSGAGADRTRASAGASVSQCSSANAPASASSQATRTSSASPALSSTRRTRITVSIPAGVSPPRSGAGELHHAQPEVRHGAHGGQELVQVHGLRDEAVRVQAVGVEEVALRVRRAEDHDGDVLQPGILLHPGEHLAAAQLGEVEVEEDEIRVLRAGVAPLLSEELDRLEAVARHRDVARELADRVDDEIGVAGVVLHEEDVQAAGGVRYVVFHASHARQGELEGCAGAGLGLDPDAAPVALDDLLADGEANPGARVLGAGVQPLEDDEDPVQELRIDADPVVLHREQPLVAPRNRGHVDRGSLAGPAELDRVPDEVLEGLRQATGVPGDARERAARDDGVALLDRGSEVQERLIERRAHVDRSGRLVDPADARELQQAADERLHALRALDRVVDVLLRLRVHLPRVALLEELHVARDHPERLLEVVRGDVGELLQLGVRSRERVRLLPERALGGAALGHLPTELRVHGLDLALLVLEVVEDIQDRALGRLEPLLLPAEVLENVEEGALHLALPRPLLAAVVEDVEDRALRVLEPQLLVGEVVEDVEDRPLRLVLPEALPAEVLEDVEDGAVRVRQRELELCRVGARRRHQRESRSGGPCLRSSSISFFSSIILSSRPTVSRWKRSSSPRRSSSRVRWSATSCSALFWALTSRAAANTPSTFPRKSLYTDAL